MLVLSISINNIINSIVSYFKSLLNGDKFVIYIVAGLLVILVILLIILVEQVKYYKKKKLVDNKVVESKPINNEKTEVLNIDTKANEKTRNLQEITQKLQEVIDNRNNGLNKFELEQEENSIISYDELLKANGKTKNNYKEEFSMPELARKIEVNDIIEEPKPVINPVKESIFKASDFISPVYGIQNKVNREEKAESKVNESVVIEEDDIIDDTPIMENKSSIEEESFLSSLRNLRNNLN